MKTKKHTALQLEKLILKNRSYCEGDLLSFYFKHYDNIKMSFSLFEKYAFYVLDENE